MRWSRLALRDERGATTIEYTMVLAFMATISIFVTISLIGVMKNVVAVLTIKIAIFLTSFPTEGGYFMFESSLSRLFEWAFHGLRSAQARFKVLTGKASDESGAITIEYILIIALIAIIIITLFTIMLWPALKPALETLIKSITEAIGGGAIT